MVAVCFFVEYLRYHRKERNAAVGRGEKEYHKWGIWVWSTILAFALVDFGRDACEVLFPRSIVADRRLFLGVLSAFTLLLCYLGYRYLVAGRVRRSGPEREQ